MLSQKKKLDQQDSSINFTPDMAGSLDASQLNKCQQQMLEIMQVDEVHRNAGHLAELMSATSVNRYHLINSKQSIRDIQSHYPALFTSDGILAVYTAMVQQTLNAQTMPSFHRKLSVTAGHLMKLTDSVNHKSRSRASKQLQCNSGYNNY